jgi:very-short-patch-repair endonuclease
VGHPRLSRSGVLTAAVLAAGKRAALGHWSAVEWWGLAQGRERSPIEVCVPQKGGRSRQGLIVHRCGTLIAGDLTVRRGVPVTTVERTLLDIASRARLREVERLLDEAHRLRLYDRHRLESVLSRRLAGSRLLRAVLLGHEAGSTWTRNDFEEAFLALVDRAGLPRPHMNDPVGPLEVDCHWPGHRFAVELDGRGTHLTPRAFEDDRERDGYLYAEHGIVTLRFTYLQVTKSPAVVIHRLRRALDG